LIKKDSNLTELLVVFPEIDNWYRGKDMEFSFDDAETVQFEEDSHHIHPPHVVEMPVSNGQHAHVEHTRDEVTVVKVAPSSHVTDAYTPSHQEVIKEHHEEIKHVPVEAKRQSPPAPRAAPVHAQSNGAPDLFRLSAAEMRERLSSQKKADPRKSDSSNLSLKQKYDIIQSL